MAVRFDATGENYTSTSSPPAGTYTVTCWAKVSSDRNTWSAVWASDSSMSNYVYLATDSDGTTMKAWTQVSGNDREITGPNMTVGTWYRLALVVNGANATLYHGTASGTLSAPNSTTWQTIAATTTFRVGSNPFSGEWLNGCIANLKHYSTDLTQAEIERELAQYLPARTANLVRWHPFLTNETTDYSGNARTLSGGTGTAREDGPPIPWHAARPRMILPAASGSTTVTLGQASETSTANAVARLKTKALGQPAETDTSTTLTRRKTRATGQVTETDASTSLARSKTRQLGQATEADTATVVTRAKRRAVSQASETDTVAALSRARSRILGQPTETDSLGSLARAKTFILGRATEAETAAAPSRVKAKAIGQPSESDTAQVLSGAKHRTLGQTQETDTAQPVSQAGSLVVVLGQSAETGTAQAMGHGKVKALGQSSETDTSPALTAKKTRAIGLCTELDTPFALARSKTSALTRAQETDSATAATRAKARGIGQAAEADSAHAVAPLGALVLRQVISTETATPLAKRRVLVGVSEVDVALALTVGTGTPALFVGRPYRIGMSTTGHQVRTATREAPRISGSHSGGSSIRNPESL